MERKTFIKIIGIIILFSIFMIINITNSEASTIEELRSTFDMTDRIDYSLGGYVTTLKLTPSSTTVYVGKHFYVEALVNSYGDITDYGVNWTVTGQNLVNITNETSTSISFYAVSAGQITVKATTRCKNDVLEFVTKSVTITIKKESSSGGDTGGEDTEPDVGTEFITISPKSASIGVGESFTFSLSSSGAGYFQCRDCSCNDCDVMDMSYSSAGITVTGKAVGTHTIIAWLQSNPSVTATATVTVGGSGTDPTVTPTISVTPKSKTIKVGESVTFSASIQNCTDCQYTCQCLDNCNIIDLKSGSGGIIVTGLAPGTATLKFYISSYPSVSTTATVTVEADTVSVTGISLNKQNMTLEEGSTEKLTATVTPSNATNKNVTWKSSVPSVATVDSNGLVTAVSPGTAVITATTQDGGKTATCAVTVNERKISVTGISLNKSTTTINVGEYDTLIATVTPSNATNKNVTWGSNNTSVATVDNNGKVTAISAGTAVITATTVDGGKQATCTVTVKLPDSVVSSNKYIVKENEILRILPSTTKEEFLSNITVTNGTPLIHPKDSSNEISSGELIKTGMKMEVTNKTYTLIVIGDINEDGKCTLIDLSNLKLHLISVKTLTNENFLAADVDLNNTVSLTDISIMKRFLIGLYSF